MSTFPSVSSLSQTQKDMSIGNPQFAFLKTKDRGRMKKGGKSHTNLPPLQRAVKIDILDSILQVLFNDSYSFLGLNKKISETNRLDILVAYYLF